MKILYDPHVFNSCAYGGIAKYCVELYKNLPTDVKPIPSVVESDNVHLREAGFSLQSPMYTFHKFLPGLSFRGKSWLYHSLGRYLPFIFHFSEETNERNFKRLVYGNDFDVVHITGVRGHRWVFDECARANKPVVVTCFDLIPELCYKDKAAECENRYAYAAATHIIAISANTKRDLCDFYHVAEDKVSVVYLGSDVSISQEAELGDPINGCRYILYVGKRTGYKNFDFFVRAITPILKQNSSLKVFCTGAPFSKWECELFEQLGVEASFIQQFVSDEQLPYLYHNALAFIYPSLHEGFGIPILDAFANGCPTLLANATCFPEVGGDAALYFDPKNEDDFRRQLMRVIDDGDQARGLRADMIARGKERVKLFSWKKCAEETAEVYRQCVSGGV